MQVRDVDRGLHDGDEPVIERAQPVGEAVGKVVDDWRQGARGRARGRAPPAAALSSTPAAGYGISWKPRGAYELVLANDINAV